MRNNNGSRSGILFRIALVVGYLSGGAICALADPPQYSVIDLGTLGGDHSAATALNNSGQVTGWSEVVPGNTGVVHAFIYSNGVMQDLGTLPGCTSSKGFGINSSGAVAGSSYQPQSSHAFVYSNGSMKDLGTLPGGSTSFGSAINDAGQVCGSSDFTRPTTSTIGNDAFLYSDGQIHDLGTLDPATPPRGGSSEAFGINKTGDVAGFSYTATGEFHAFLYSGGSMQDLGTWSTSQGRDVNDSGSVTGFWDAFPDSSNGFTSPRHAFIWNGVITDLGALTPKGSSFGYAINNAGHVVGNSDASDNKVVGFLFAPTVGSGPMYNLNDLVPASSGFVNINFSDETRKAINDAGQIAAIGLRVDGAMHAVLLTPVTGTATPTPTPNGTATPTPTVTPTPTPAQLLNISTRLDVQTGDNALIGGFIVTGSEPKKVIVRAIGPSLPVSGALSDPVLELHDGKGAQIGFNDNWKDSQQTEIQNSGVAPSDDRESAIVQTLAPGNYTAIVRGKDDATGVGLVEAYDLSTAASSKIVNISTRGFIETQDKVLIGGFIIGNAKASTRVIVRAIGPSLAGAGVPNALQDPTLELHDQNGATFASNDNWQDDPGAAEIQREQLAPTDSHESATIQTLNAGNYTAIVRGVNNTAGVGLVEVYNINN